MDESPKPYSLSLGEAMQAVVYLMIYATLGSGSLAGRMYFSGLTSHLSVTAFDRPRAGVLSGLAGAVPGLGICDRPAVLRLDSSSARSSIDLGRRFADQGL